MRIGFDLDGVLANFYSSYVKNFEEYYKIKFPPDFFDGFCYPKAWYCEDVIPNSISRELEKEFICSVIGGIRDFWLNLDSAISKETWLRMKKLLSEHEVFFISNRTANPTIIDTKTQSSDWLAEHLIQFRPFDKQKDSSVLLENIKNVIITNNKLNVCKLLKLDLMIEDNLQTFIELNSKIDRHVCFLLSRSYNRASEELLRDTVHKNFYNNLIINSVDKYLDIIEKGAVN